jgi:putative phage-type endonuclease
MGDNPWKSKLTLYHEKLSDDLPSPPNEAMARGVRLEPIARDKFNQEAGWNMKPAIIVRGWAMASLDGRDEESGDILEIKCPGEKTHAAAVGGHVPSYYYPQLQHQMYVCGVQTAYYYSFDGVNGVTVKVERNDEYIEKMLVEEEKFYDCLMLGTPPETFYGFEKSYKWKIRKQGNEYVDI